MGLIDVATAVSGTKTERVTYKYFIRKFQSFVAIDSTSDLYYQSFFLDSIWSNNLASVLPSMNVVIDRIE